MNELWYDDLSLKSEDIKILPIKFEYLIGRHFKKWGVYFFTRFWKEVNLWKQKIKNQKVVPHSLRPSNIHSANKKERIVDILPMPKGRGFLDTNDTCLLK